MKSLIIKIACALLLLSTIAFLFIPAVRVQQSVSSEGEKTKTTYINISAVELIKSISTSEDDSKKIHESGSKGEIFAFEANANDGKNGITDGKTPTILTMFIISSVMFACFAGIAIIIRIFKIKNNIKLLLSNATSFFLIASFIAAVGYFICSFIWVSGEVDLVAVLGLSVTKYKSIAHAGPVIAMLIPIITFVLLWKHRELKKIKQ